jgi:phosphoribosylcarboxyaminoimidazole (NCAIR) mutase
LLSTTGKDNGYELSLVRIFTKKNNKFEIKTGELAKREELKDVRITELKELITFDFYNTDQYKIKADSILLTNVLDNAVIMDWVTGEDTRNGQLNIQNPYKQNKENKAMLVHKEVGAEKTLYTYVFFRYGMSIPTALDIQPTGAKDKLMLNFLFTRDTSETALKIDPEDPNYMLYYITVEADNSVDIEISYFMNVTSAKPETEAAIKKPYESPVSPNYTLLGNLNTELVKYMNKLNSDLVAIINQCKEDIRTGTSTFADFEQLVVDLQLLLSTGDNYALTASALKGKYMQAYARDPESVLAGAGAFAKLHQNIMSYTAFKITGDPIKWSTISGGNTPETIVQYDSPYGIYYKWLEKYGYLPTK